MRRMTSIKSAWGVLAVLVLFGSVACGGNKPPPPKPLPDSELMDSDGDGVGDKEDKCSDKKEDGLAPKPKDGCPKED